MLSYASEAICSYSMVISYSSGCLKISPNIVLYCKMFYKVAHVVMFILT